MARINTLGWIEFSDIIKTVKKSADPTSFYRSDGRDVTDITHQQGFRAAVSGWITSSYVIGSGFNYDVVTGRYARDFTGSSYWGGRDRVAFANNDYRAGVGFYTTSGSDLLLGGSGNDGGFVFNGVQGFDLIDGSTGDDTVNVTLSYKDFYTRYDIQRVGTLLNSEGRYALAGKRTDFIKITDRESGEYTLLVNIERLRFSIENIVLSTGIPDFNGGALLGVAGTSGYVAYGDPTRPAIEYVTGKIGSITSSTPNAFNEGVTLTAPGVTGDPDGDSLNPNYAYKWLRVC